MKTGLNHAVRVTVAALSIVLGFGVDAPAAAQCPGDVVATGGIDGTDLAAVLGAWGTNGQGPLITDLNSDGIVNGGDLAMVLGGWGPCPPAITSILPNNGPTSGGTPITITGNYFSGAATVTLGGIPATDVEVVDTTTITAVTPAGVVGATTVAVTTPSGIASLVSGFSFSTVMVPPWATLIESLPDPAVVTDANLAAAITATGLAWRVKDTSTQIELLLIPPGTFQMGCTASLQFGCRDDNPQHTVTLTNPFYLGRYEVSQAQWSTKMGYNPSFFQSASNVVLETQVPNRPVEGIGWNTIQGFLSLTGMRLPTEAEWEYAYRAGTTSAFHSSGWFPNGTSDDNMLGSIAWYASNASDQTHPVGGKSGNGLGLHDMAGNVWEWVSDWYGNYGSVAQVNPAGPSDGSFRVVRGGYMLNNSQYCRASHRDGVLPGVGYSYLGFRVARNP